MSKIINKLDTLHSIYLRLEATDENGQGNCAICDAPTTYDNLVCGHMIKRRHTQFRWNKRNTAAICSHCNGIEESTTQEPMRDFKISVIGFDEVNSMYQQSRTSYKFSRVDKDTLLKTRRLQCRNLLKTKNFNVTIP